jgi:hypothetical protein
MTKKGKWEASETIYLLITYAEAVNKYKAIIEIRDKLNRSYKAIIAKLRLELNDNTIGI